MRDMSRVVPFCLSLLVVAGPVWAALPAENPADPKAKALTDAPTAVISNAPGGSVRTIRAGDDSKYDVSGDSADKPSAKPAGGTRTAPAGSNASIRRPARPKYTQADKDRLNSSKDYRRWVAAAKRSKEFAKTLKGAYTSFGPGFIDSESTRRMLDAEMRAQIQAGRLEEIAMRNDPGMTEAFLDDSDAFMGEAGQFKDDGVAPVVGGPAGDGGAAICNEGRGCDDLRGQLARVTDDLAKVNALLAEARRAPPAPATVPVPVAERVLPGNSVSVGFNAGPLLQALLGGLLGGGGLGGRGRGGPAYARGPYGPYGPNGYGRPMYGYAGNRFGPGGPFGPRFAGGYGNQFGGGNGRAPVVGGPAFGGYGGAQFSPAYAGIGSFPGQNWNSGAGVLYQQSASASAPLSMPLGGLTSSSLMQGSMNAPVIAGPARFG